MSEYGLSEEEQLVEEMAGFEFDPYGFVMFAFPWGEKGRPLEKKKGPRRWQKKLLIELGEKLEAGWSVGEVIQLAVASGHGIGKSALIAWMILWAMSTFEDTRGRVTANTETQLRTFTWAELSKWYWMCITKHWFELTATAIFSTDPMHAKTWRVDAVPWSKSNPQAVAGLHNEGKRIILLFDEASNIPDIIWETAEGALTDADTQIIWVAFGNPTSNTGRFRECFRRFREFWRVWQIDSRTVEDTNQAQFEKWAKQHDEDSDFMKIRVRGQFPSQSARQFISETDADAGRNRHLRPEQYNFAPIILTLDNAWTGDDEIDIGFRQGLYSENLLTLPFNDNDVEIANCLARFEDDLGADAVIIDMGYGTGVYSCGKTWGRDWICVSFGEASPDPGYLNLRAYMWGQMKQWLKDGGTYDGDELFYELTSVETVPRTDGKIQLESKEDIKAKGLPSPNKADRLALSFARPVVSRKSTSGSFGKNPDKVQGGNPDPLA